MITRTAHQRSRKTTPLLAALLCFASVISHPSEFSAQKRKKKKPCISNSFLVPGAPRRIQPVNQKLHITEPEAS
jgi:hypothetical protein